jgi:DNA-binding winged helix-turn-helix (wHTH) protein/tetratricopeptide (TPR) repeat protein
MAGDESVYAFSSFRVDPARRVILRGTQPVRVTAKVFDLLLELLRSRGRVVTRDELMARLWPETIVEDGNLSVNISALRKALEDSRSAPIIETLPRVGYRFVAETREERAPPAITNAHARAAQRHDSALMDLPFVGREGEMTRLQHAFEQAAGGAGGVVFIHGEPGIGKTTLAERFLASLAREPRSAQVTVGRCLQQHGAGEAYLPFLEAFNGLLAGPRQEPARQLFAEQAPSWRRHLPSLFGPVDETQEPGSASASNGPAGQQLLRQAQAAIAALSRSAPLVILLDDLHWADPSSLDVLRLLGQQASAPDRRSAEAPQEAAHWLVIGTFRASEVFAGAHPVGTLVRELGIHDRCLELPLEALGRAPVEQYLGQRFGQHDFPEGLITLLLQKTQGHPLLFTRLTQWLVDRDDVASDGSVFHLVRPLSELTFEAPQSIENLILRKLDFLTLEEQRALTYASIEGDEFTSTILAELLGIDEVELDERLERLSRVHRWFDVLGEEAWPSGKVASRYRFGHALFRDYLHSKIVPKRRRQLHQRAAAALIEHHHERASELAAQLAAHFEESGDTEQAVKYRTTAGYNAKRAFASREAEAHFSRALELVDQLPEDQRAPHQLVLYEERAWRRYDLDSFDAASDDFAKLKALAARSNERDAHWGAVSGSAWTAMMRLDRATYQAQMNELSRLAEEWGDDKRKAEAQNHLAAMYLDLDGELERAHEHVGQSLALARQLGHERALVTGLQLSGAIEFLRSRYEAAVVSYSDLLERVPSAIYAFFGPEVALIAYYERGLSQLNLGQVSLALADFESARAFAERTQYWSTLGVIHNCVAGVHLELEDYPEAMRRSREVLAMPPERAHARARLHAGLDLALGHVRCATPDSSAADRALADARSCLDSEVLRCNRLMALLRTPAVQSELFLAKGELGAAADSARELVALAGRQGSLKHLARAHGLLARTASARGAHAEARAELLTALHALERAPCPRLAWRLWGELARVELALADENAARTALQRAAAGIEQLALNIADPALRAAFLGSPRVQSVLAARAIHSAS